MDFDYKTQSDRELTELLAAQTMKLALLYPQKVSYESMINLKEKIKKLEEEIRARAKVRNNQSM